MTQHFSQEEINGILWKACDTFRGVIDPSEYKNYILVMLFVKYISDVWQDHYEALQKLHGDDEAEIQRRLECERFVLPKGCDFAALYRQRNAANLGEIINRALGEIEEANKAKLAGVFRNIDFDSETNLGEASERSERLRQLLEDFADRRLDLRPSRVGSLDIIGNAYEFLIGKFASGAGKKAGEFYTPPEVSRLLACLLDPQPGDRICDPACGSGSLLIKCARQAAGPVNLFGQEAIGGTWALCLMNMFLHGIENPRIERGDTLGTPKLLENEDLMTFDVVVANPPFSLDKWGAERAGQDPYKRFQRGIPPRSKGDYAFISHMVASMARNGGRAGVIAPHGVLFRAASEQKIRRKLISENLLEAVIGLPPNLFFGTDIPAVVLVFRRDRTDRKVLFIDASRSFATGKNQNKLRARDIEAIVSTFRQRLTIERFSYLADFEEIQHTDFTLNIARYVDTFEEERETDIHRLQAQIEDCDAQMDVVRHRMAGFMEGLSIGRNR